MQLIIVSGSAATGKTAIGREIALLMGYAYLSKDSIKEALFDSETHNTWDYSWYEKRAKLKLFKEIKNSILGNKSVVIDSNFISKDRDKLKNCLNDTVQVSEIFVTTKGFVGFRRFIRRNEHGIRHRDHHDRRWYPTVFAESLLNCINIRWPYRPLKFNQKLVSIDTTDFSKVDYKKITEFAKQT